MIDLVLREVMTSPHITNKAFATQCIIESFVRILRGEGYAVTDAVSSRCSPTPIDSLLRPWHMRRAGRYPVARPPSQCRARSAPRSLFRERNRHVGLVLGPVREPLDREVSRRIDVLRIILIGLIVLAHGARGITVRVNGTGPVAGWMLEV